MFGWLNSLLGWASSGLDDLWKKVISIFKTVYSYIDGWINQIIKDINSVYQYVWSLYQAGERFAQSIYTAVVSWGVKQFNSIVSWASKLWSQLYSFIQSVIVWAAKEIAQVRAYIDSYLSNLVNWILKNIWDPLYNFISGAVKWIETYGTWAIYLLTHPDQLALILGRYILASWLGLGKKYAGLFGRWLVHGMLSLTSDVAGILEDIIAGIL